MNRQPEVLEHVCVLVVCPLCQHEGRWNGRSRGVMARVVRYGTPPVVIFYSATPRGLSQGGLYNAVRIDDTWRPAEHLDRRVHRVLVACVHGTRTLSAKLLDAELRRFECDKKHRVRIHVCEPLR
jgi:hypothetical protein